MRGSVEPLPGKYTGNVPPLKLFPRSTSSAKAACHPDFTSRYEPNPVDVRRGSIMPIAWKGAPIHQSIAPESVALVVELTWMLPLRAAVSPAAV